MQALEEPWLMSVLLGPLEGESVPADHVPSICSPTSTYECVGPGPNAGSHALSQSGVAGKITRTSS